MIALFWDGVFRELRGYVPGPLDYLYVNPPTPQTPPTRPREQTLEPLLGPLDGHAAVRLADGELVDDVLLLGLHLP